jgi:hypothetical protein
MRLKIFSVATLTLGMAPIAYNSRKAPGGTRGPFHRREETNALATYEVRPPALRCDESGMKVL